MKWVCVLVMTTSCFAQTPLLRFGGGAAVQTSQNQELERVAPGDLGSTSRWNGPMRNGRLRVWADDDDRTQNLDWQHGFDRELEAANTILGPMLGLHLDAEYRKWDRHAPGTTLEDALRDLHDLDPGDDVVAVVGLTSSLSLASATFEQIGLGDIAGPHFVLRGYPDTEERKSFEIQLRRLDAMQRDEMIAARRRHKTTTVLLHELAHSLGAIHERGDSEVMSPIYSHEATSISERNRELMLIVLADRLQPIAKRDPRATEGKMLAATDKPWEAAISDERDELLARLRANTGGKPAMPATTPRLHDAEQRLADGDIKGAHAIMEKLLVESKLIDSATLLVACKIELADASPAANAACDRAAQARDNVTDPAVIVDAAIAVVPAMTAAHDLRGAVRILGNAEKRIGTGEPARAAWLALADHYRDLDAVSAAEHAIANTGLAEPNDKGIAAWVTTTRARFGIPKGIADESEAIAAVRDALVLLNKANLDGAAAAVAAAEKRWPALPGLVAERCDVAIHRRQLAAAHESCARAAEGGSSWALYLDGSLDLDAGANGNAVTKLQRAIVLDPELRLAWPHSVGRSAVQRRRPTSIASAATTRRGSTARCPSSAGNRARARARNRSKSNAPLDEPPPGSAARRPRRCHRTRSIGLGLGLRTLRVLGSGSAFGSLRRDLIEERARVAGPVAAAVELEVALEVLLACAVPPTCASMRPRL